MRNSSESGLAGAAQPGLTSDSDDRQMLDEMVAAEGLQFVSRFVRVRPDRDAEHGYRTALHLLREMQPLSPQDPDLIRRIISAADALDETETLIEARRRLLRLDPSDAVNQWHVIRHGLHSLQSAERRLAACENLLADGAARLDRSVLSRIAFEAALLRHEQGRASIAADHLSTALRLDPTNLDAAALRALEIDRQTVRRDLLVQAMIDLVKADPTNLTAVGDLSALLAEVGAYRASLEMYRIAIRLYGRAGRSMPDEEYAEVILMVAAVEGPEHALDRLDRRREAQTQAQRRGLQEEWWRTQVAEAREHGRDPPTAQDVPKFEDVSVTPAARILFVRLVLADAGGDVERIESALTDLERMWSDGLDALDRIESDALPESAREALQEERRLILEERLWARLWVGRGLDAAAADLDALEQAQALHPAEVQRYRGWLALRQGDGPLAASLLRPLGEVDARAAVGLALLSRQPLPDPQSSPVTPREAQRFLTEVHLAQPGTPLGLWCRLRLEEWTGETQPTTHLVRTVERSIGSMPRILTDLLERPDRQLHLRVRILQDEARSLARPLDDLIVEVAIRNDSPWPLPIGPDKAISSRFALTPIVFHRGRRVPLAVPPVTLDLQRQFMLRSGETLRVNVNLSRTPLRRLLTDLAVRPMTVRFQGILDYAVGPEGGVGPQPWSVIRESAAIELAPWTADEAETLRLHERLALDDRVDLNAVAALGAMLRTTRPEQDRTHLERSMARLVELWPEMDDLTRAWVVVHLPLSEARAPMPQGLERLESLVQRSADRYTMIAWLTAHASQPDDVILQSAIRSDDETLRQLAQAMREYLTAPEDEE